MITLIAQIYINLRIDSLIFCICKGFVDWRHTTHPGLQLNDKYLGEMFINQMGNKILPQETLELNDCLYRNIYKYKYLALIDIDEVIAPVEKDTLTDMMIQIQVSAHNYIRSMTDKVVSCSISQQCKTSPKLTD